MIVWKIDYFTGSEPTPTPLDVNSIISNVNGELGMPFVILKKEDRTNSKIEEPEHCHSFIEMEYIAAGSCLQNINGNQYQLRKGDVVFLNIGDKHSYVASSDVNLVNCIFNYELFLSIITKGDFKQLIPLPNVVHLSGEYIREFEIILEKMEREYNKKDFGYKMILDNYVTILVVMLLRFATKTAPNQRREVSEILEYIDANFSIIKLEDVANKFNFNPSYFSRFFKLNVGITFSLYIKNKRIEKALQLLKTTELTNEEICEQLGFKSKNQFYKIFREFMGKTPYDIRKKNKLN